MQRLQSDPKARLVAGGVLAVALGGAAVAVLRLRAPQPEAPVVVPQIRTVSSQEAAAYAGSAACARCHADEFKTHENSHHALALTAVDAKSHGERFQAPSGVEDPERSLKFKTTVSGDRCVLVAAPAGGAPQVAEALWAFGSGKHAITYHGEISTGPVELRLSYYTKAKRWDFSPGQQMKAMSGGVLHPAGLQKAPETVEGCFTCHATAVVKESGKLLPKLAAPGVQCEACHGPGRTHIEAAEKGWKDLKMPRLGLARDRVSTELCGQCHRSPAGDSLADPYNLKQMPRFQGLALSQSACYRESQGKLTCLSCHDPHSNDRRTDAEHSQVCISCHGAQPTQQICPIEPKGNCLPCHMPAQSVGMPTDLKYRNHWIKVWSTLK